MPPDVKMVEVPDEGRRDELLASCVLRMRQGVAGRR